MSHTVDCDHVTLINHSDCNNFVNIYFLLYIYTKSWITNPRCGVKLIGLLVKSYKWLKLGALFVQNILYEDWYKYSKLKIWSFEWNFGSQIWSKFQTTSKSRSLVESSKIRKHFSCNYSFFFFFSLKNCSAAPKALPCTICFWYIIPGGLMFLIFCSVLISVSLQVNLILKILGKFSEIKLKRNFTKNIPLN